MSTVPDAPNGVTSRAVESPTGLNPTPFRKFVVTSGDYHDGGTEHAEYTGDATLDDMVARQIESYRSLRGRAIAQGTAESQLNESEGGYWTIWSHDCRPAATLRFHAGREPEVIRHDSPTPGGFPEAIRPILGRWPFHDRLGRRAFRRVVLTRAAWDALPDEVRYEAVPSDDGTHVTMDVPDLDGGVAPPRLARPDLPDSSGVIVEGEIVGTPVTGIFVRAADYLARPEDERPPCGSGRRPGISCSITTARPTRPGPGPA